MLKQIKQSVEHFFNRYWILRSLMILMIISASLASVDGCSERVYERSAESTKQNTIQND